MGEHFVSRGGVLLRKLFEQAGIEEAYETLAVKCMPTKKNEPTEEHIQICKEWLFKETAKLKPRVILTLGSIPTRSILKLKKNFRMSDYVGQFHLRCDDSYGVYREYQVAPWYSPQYILQRGKKFHAQSIEFFKQVQAVHLGL